MLTEFDCSGNKLTTLDVSKNTALIWLLCEENQLTTLDVSKNAAMLTLDCRYNKIPSKAAVTGRDDNLSDDSDTFFFAPQFGDVNGDGSINTTDVRLVLQSIVGKVMLTNDFADVNQDNKVDTVDARLILQLIVGKIEHF